MPSIQSLFLDMRHDGQPLATGTGFVVQSKIGPVLITNRHNVTGRHQDTGETLSATKGVPNEIVITHNAKGQLGIWHEEREPLFLENGMPRWIEHPTLGAKADFVALPLSQTHRIDLYEHNIENIGIPPLQIAPAEVCSVVGFPFGMRAGGSLAIWATGFVATEPDIDFDGLPIFLIDCRSRKGQSGSAVIAQRNNVTYSNPDGTTSMSMGITTKFLGIYSGRICNESDLGKVWKASAIIELIASLQKSI